MSVIEISLPNWCFRKQVTAVDYSYVRIGDTSFLLPVHAESLGCERGTSYCSHNIIDFRNYHEFKSEIKITPH